MKTVIIDDKKKCGVAPDVRMAKCPPIKKNREPDTADCQACSQAVEVGRGSGYPINELEA